MKDATHHIRHLQRKVIQSSRKAKEQEERANGKNAVMGINPLEESVNFKKRK